MIENLETLIALSKAGTMMRLSGWRTRIFSRLRRLNTWDDN